MRSGPASPGRPLDWPTTVERGPPTELGADYDTEWSRRYPARLVRAVLLDNVTRPLAHAVAAPEVRGAEMLELVEPPAIFVANHASHVDTGLLLSVLPRRFRHKTVVAGAADYFFDRRWKAHLWALGLGAIPIERHKVNRKSADTAAGLLEEGWNLIIFPEGGRSPDGWFQEFQRRGRLPGPADGRSGRPRPHRGHRADPAQGRRPARGGSRPGSPSGPPAPGRGESRPGASGAGSRRPSPPWPTRTGPTGGRPAGAPPRRGRPRRPGAPDAAAWRRLVGPSAPHRARPKRHEQALGRLRPLNGTAHRR